MARYIKTGENVDKTKFIGDEPKETKFDAEQGPVRFNDIKLFYNYGTESDPCIQEVFLEGPLMKSDRFNVKDEGMKTSKKGNQYHKITYSMMLRFDLSTPENKEETLKCLSTFREAYLGCAHAMAPFKGKVGMHHFNPEQPEGTLNDFVYWYRNSNGDIIQGKEPVMWCDFSSYGPHKTLITDMKGQAIDWKMLENSEVEMVPLFHISMIRVGTIKKIKVGMKSAIVTKIIQSGSETTQVDTLERLKNKYGAQKIDEVEAQLAELRMNKQDQMAEPKPDFGSPNHVEEEVPKEKEESMEDFLSSAPPMNSPTPQATQTTTLPKMQTLKIN
jgi:hypothetical protein